MLICMVLVFSLVMWQPTPVFLPGESHGRGSLVGCRPWVAQSRTRLRWLSSSSSSSSSDVKELFIYEYYELILCCFPPVQFFLSFMFECMKVWNSYVNISVGLLALGSWLEKLALPQNYINQHFLDPFKFLKTIEGPEELLFMSYIYRYLPH